MSTHHFNWNNNAIQFPRLIAEAEAAGVFDADALHEMAEGMDLSVAEVCDLIGRAQLEFDTIKEKDRVNEIAYQEAQKAQLDREAQRQSDILAYNRLVAELKRVIKPGDLLKMRGCRDGHGLREFIRWSGDGDLVCWQINRVWNGKSYQNETGGQVTTHMADKVRQVYVNGVPFPIKSILK